MSSDTSAPADALAFTTDTLLDGRVILKQPAAGYRVAIDPVFLAAAVPARPGERVLDAGSGVGAATLCLAARIDGIAIEGLDIDADLAALARDNAGAGGCAGRARFHIGDLRAPPPELRSGGLDHVMTNPPFLEAGRAQPSPQAAKARATVEGAVPLADWLHSCLRLLRPKGTLTLIHRADRLDWILAALAGHAGTITLLPLWPRAGVPAKRVIVRATKGASGPARLLAGLVLHDGHGGYTAEANAILRDGAGIDF